jgi:hypothetical protein
MTDHLTEAVRRLRQLQEDVERLKSGGDQGQLRELRRVDDPVAVGDPVTVGPDVDVADATATADDASSRLNDAEATDSTTTTDSATVSNIQTATPAVCDVDNADKSDAG